MVRNKGVRELISGDSHGEQVGDAVGEEGFFEDFAHGGSLARLFDQHVGDGALEIVGVGVGDGGVIPAQDFKNKAFHRVGIKCMSQSDHLIQNASKRPNV